MSLTPRLTLIGLYNYNGALFDALTFPEGINKETFVESLLLRYGECPVLYANGLFMAYAIGAWGRKWYDSFARIYNTLSDNYNPLYNYDRYEESTDEENRSGTGRNVTENHVSDSEHETADIDETGSGTTTGAAVSTETGTETTEKSTDGTVTETITHGKTTTETDEISAMNASTYQPDAKKTVTETGTTVTGTVSDIDEESETSTGKNSRTDTEEHRSDTHGRDEERTKTFTSAGTVTSNMTDSGERENTHSAHLFGNIGVTTSQAMALEEIALRTRNNLYDILCEVFRNELLLYLF